MSRVALRRLGLIAIAVLGIVALAPGLYGLWGLSIVVGDYLACQDGRLGTAVSVASSYPSGFCQTTDWTRSFAIGFGLLGVGMAGVVAIVVALRSPGLDGRS